MCFSAKYLAALAALAVACASPAAVSDTYRPESPGVWLDDQERREQIDDLLAEPLTMETALKVAVLNNPGLQADLAAVDVRAARFRDQATMANPEFDTEFFIFGPDSWGLHRVEASLEFELTSMLTRAVRLRAASQGVEASRAEAAGRILDFTAELRRSWIHYVAARQYLDRQRRVHRAAQAAAETAGIYHEAGNIADDELYRLQAFGAEARRTLLHAEDSAGYWREELALLLSEPVDGDWSAVAELQAPPDELSSVVQPVLEEKAIERSPRLQRMELETRRHEELARASRWQGWLPALRLGVVADWREAEVEWGPTLGVDVPIFDRRQYERDALQARQIELHFQRRQQINRLRTHTRRVMRRLEQSHLLVTHYAEEVLPIRERLAGETLRQYNAMTIGVFELLETRRAHLVAEAAYVEVLRDYWLARAEYEHLLAGGTFDDDRASGQPEH